MSVKLEGVASAGEVPYTLPSTVTDVMVTVYVPACVVRVVGPTLYKPSADPMIWKFAGAGPLADTDHADAL